jgi:hypothetical protein
LKSVAEVIDGALSQEIQQGHPADRQAYERAINHLLDTAYGLDEPTAPQPISRTSSRHLS